ncbi:MAG TPA: DUF4105 domain-containing protein [Kofleriaceae bacterium]|nr:DUF4105 domain-containing protein [Kofleriaceae bacterium]
MRAPVPAIAVLTAVLAAAGAAGAQPAHLAPGEAPSGAIEPDPPVIELLTFGIGARIFEKFGHAAICLRYHQPEHPEICFNYGVTNFNAGAVMVWNFLRHEQKFWVEPTRLTAMLAFYQAEDRDIWRQTLPITAEAARAIEAQLWSDIREDHRYYDYDHFFDNCSTRLRDMIDRATGGALSAGGSAPYARTYREIGRRGLADMPLLLVTSDLITGRQLDQHPTVWQAMFHPDILRTEVALRLRAPPELIYRRHGPPFPTRGKTGRLHFLALAVALAVLLFLAYTARRYQTAMLWTWGVALAVVGAVVWAVAIISPIPAVRWNEAVFVVMPIDLALPLLSPGRRQRYAQIRLGVLAAVAALGLVGVFHQPLWAVILAVALPMATIAFDLPHGRQRPE